MKKNREFIKRLVSLFMALMMTFTCLPLEVFAEEIGEERNAWSGRSAVFVGDSITAGAGVTKKYYQHLAESFDFDSFTAMGVGGSCISAASDYGQNNQPLINRYQNIPSVDLIMIFMGTNDYGHETPLGTVEDTQDGTFYGALNAIVPALVAKHTSSKIVFVTPIHRYGFGTSKILGTNFTYDSLPNGVGATLEDYVKAIKAVCTNNDVDVIDLYTECTLDPTDSTVRSTYMPDGLHPNDAGHAYIAEIMAAHIADYEPVEKEPLVLPEMIQGNKFASGNDQPCRASSRINYYLEEGTVITLKDPAAMQWACAKTSNENSSNNLGYFPDSQWTDKETAVVAEDGWIGFTFKYRDETRSFDLTKPLSDYITIEAPHTHNYTTTVTAPTCTEQGFTTHVCECGDSYVDSYVEATGHDYKGGKCTACGEKYVFAGKKVSILSHSMSTYAGVSNNTSHNSTIGNNDVYYTAGKHGVYREDTWWQQAIDALGMELLVNNSWSGSCVFMPRKGEASIGYGDRAVNLHNDHTGEKPDIIWVYLGGNDFAYYKDTFGKAADANYSALIKDNGDGTFTYATPQTTCEAYAIMLHKVETRYPDAQIYCMTSTARRETDYAGDSYPDAGQPTEYSAQLQLIAKHYGFPVVDLESAIPKDVEIFDKYMGDKRAHANALGMDQISNALLTVMLGEDAEIRHVTSEKGVVAEQAVLLNGSYSAEVNVQQGYDLVVTMGGEDITSKVYSDGKITIANVTGDIEVGVTINREPQNYRWTLKNGELLSEGDTANSLQKLSGTITDGVINNGRFALSTPVVLKHDRPWAVEWKCAGDWRGVILSSDPATLAPGRMYISRTNGGQLCFGSWNGTQYNNYGVDLSTLDAETHTLRLENHIANDGSNMIWLYVDDTVVDSMDNYFIGSKNQNTTSDWVNGKDFVFPYIGSDSTPLNNCALEYLAVWENGEPATPLALRYDDHYDVTGKTVEIIDAGNKVVTIEGNYLVATGIGEAKVRIEDKLHLVTVEKAKINIVTIMGQSNAGNHFANATSDITCPIGTAYWWGNGQGVNAAEPVDYTQPSMGFHTPLLAELYAQSVAAGDPVKNVLVWQEGITSKNGQSIVKWAATETDTSGTDGTATMLKNCIAYYENHNDKFEIVNCGVYWLQGESDVSMEPEKYTKLFMAMWSDLKEAGAEYVAFFRVRKGTIDNDSEHLDLSYSGSLTAQLNMINRNADMFLVSDITENWIGNENVEHVIDVSPYLTVKDVYASTGSYSDTYGNTATYKDGLLTTTMKSLYGSNNKCHYGKFGYGIIGADAAVNMYQALNSEEFSFVMADTSGRVENQRSFKNGDTAKIDITDITENLAFRVACGSTAGTLEIEVTSGCTDITEKVIDKGITTFGTINTELLRDYDNVEIVITYYPVHGNPGKVEIEVVDNTPETAQTFIWDFNEDLNARGNDGTVLNGLNSAALLGEYKIEDGVLKAKGLQLQFTNKIKLNERKNWSIEWKFEAVDESTKGFLLCNTEESKVGTKTVYISPDVKISISDYADNYGTKGYRNYYTDDAAFTSGDVLRIANEYDSEKGRGVLRLWKNGKLIVDDFQKYGNINKTSGTLSNMTGYPLSGDFEVSYLGCKGIENFSVTGEIDYIKIITDEPATPLALRYDDHYDVTGKIVEIIDAGKPTSYQVGYGVEENKVLDTAVVTLEEETLVATGIGTAYVRIDGQLYEVAVSSAPISLMLLIGQSNMEGNEGDANKSIICPDGQVYATYGDRYDMNITNATHYAPSALTGTYREINTVGGTDGLSDYPVYMLTDEGDGRKGPDSGFAYEWVKQTGEKVWVVNASHGGTSLNVWQPETTQYEECQAMFGACAETLRKEIAAGHFTLSHMMYFWCQGCNDYDKTAEWYVNNYLSMHESLKSELAFDHDSDPNTADKTFEYGGIIPVRAGHEWRTYYREGTYTDTTTASYYESFKDLQMSGPRVAQYWMGNNPELEDLWIVCTIGEDWVWMPDGTNGVSAYFQKHYENGTVDYTPQVKQSASWYTPTTPAAVHDSIHYNQIGYNEVGRESVRNALIYMGINPDYDTETTVTFVDWTGYKEASTVYANTSAYSGSLVVPIVKPVTRCKDVTYAVSDGLSYDWYDLTADSYEMTGSLTATGMQGSVSVVEAAPEIYYAEYLNELPETFCGGVNLWPLLQHNAKYYTVSGWGTHNSGQVYSVTIPVAPGDKIWATSMGANGTNGNSISTGNGIRVTFFGDYQVITSMTSDNVYKEFAENGYLTAPAGATAVNIPMWNNSDDNELYLLSASHDTSSDICSICGKSSHTHEYSDWILVREPSAAGVGEEQRVCACGEVISREVEGVWQTHELNEHLSQLPETVCKDLNLWSVLEHDREYYHSGVKWDVNTSADVYSITIPVNPGDKVFATSFGKGGSNGGSSSGIRCTFFSTYGIAKTLSPAETYAEFSRNGGYLVAPENAVAVNIPMWNNSDANEVYLLNYEHSYTPAVTAPTCTEQGFTTHACECGDSYVDSYVDAKGHTYNSGICTACGAEGPGKTESLPIRYDDHYDVTDKSVEIIDAGIPTSYQVGHGVEENKVMDTAVVTLRDNALVATGTGTAKVKIDGILYEVTVEAAPISLLLLIGQSNMRGSEGNTNQSIVCPDGMVYATFGDDRGDTEGIMNVNNATKFAASALTGQYSTINVEGTTEHLSYYPINSLTEAGKGTFGPDSGFAYEWVKQTGEKVWVVNAAHGGSAISSWQPNATNFKEAVLLFSACQETLRKEIAAGHFTLSHMGYFWCQGCSDATMTAQQYVKKYLTMHDGLKPALTFDHDSNSSTPNVGFEFAGIIPVRAAHDYFISYREGVYTDTTTASYYESFKDLRFNGPRVAQYWMANNPDLPDIWNVCNIGEDWVWMPDGTNGVTEYFQSHYEDGTVDYTTQVKQAASWYTPTTPKAVHDSIHYNQIGYNEIGRESARNALIMLGEIEAPNVETEVKFLGWDGYSEVTMMDAYTEGRSETLVVPKVYPVWKSKEVTYTLTDGLVWDYYDLLMENDSIGGMLAAEGMSDTVTITGHTWSEWVTLSEPSVEGPGQQQRVCSHCDKTDSRTVDGVWQIYDLADHLLELPEGICGETNLWPMLPHEDVHFTSGKKWGATSTPTTSITIPVEAGDRIYATSWNKAGENGHATSDGIRLTFFNSKGIAQTLGPGESYRLFAANGGYLVAPEESIALNIVMWYDSENYEVYILNRDHTYTSGICTACGAEDPNYVPTFLYLNEAVAYLREQMKARIDTVTLRIADMELTAEQGNTMLSDAIAHTGVPTEGDYFRRNMGSKSCSVVTGEDANGVYSDVTFKFNWYTTAEMEAEVDAAVETLLNELNLWNASDYEKIVGVYDWIGENIEYDHDRYDEEGSTIEHTTYAAIVNRLAVCQGYASLYYRLLLELGVDCRVISGLAGLNGGESHAWNIVKLEGKYYNADPTWDADLKGHYRYFLCTMENFKEHVRDDEFDSESFHTQYPMSLVPYVVNATASGSVNGAIEWVLDGETGTLTVAGTGAIPSYRYGSAPWYPYRESVKSIVVSEGITEVGERAFYWCTNCTSVTLPESLVAIREYGFNNLRALQEIKLPSKLTTIEFCAFSECVGLQSIVIPNSVTTIGSSAFSNCYALTSATLSAGMTTIPDSMFFGDRNLKKVVLQNGLTTIGDTAFADCGITSFTIPATVTSIGVSAFAGCRSNNSFTVKAGNTAYKAVNGVLFTYDGKTLISYPAGKFGNSYAVPEGTVTVGRSAFSDAYMLKTITFASSVRTIQHSAFAHCDVLASITFPSGITSIGDSALRECNKLTSVTFENPDVVLGPSVFADCDGLVSVQLPTRLKELSYGMFSGCAKLKNVTIPSTVTKMGSTVFADCDSLVSITVPGNVKSLGQQAFDFCNNLETIVFEEGVESLGWICIRNAPSLKKVVLPSSITTIEKENFEECPNVVVYVNCGSVAHRYAQSNGVATSVTHNYETTVTAPTCTDRGYTTHTCAVCSNSYKDAYVSALGHSYGDWEIVKGSTCTEQGSERRDCVRCDVYETQVVEIAAHLYEAVVTPPTCTEQGYTTHTCSVCGDSYVDSYVDATGHSYGEWTVTTAPTCTEKGIERHDCKNCDHFETRAVAAKGHSEVIDEAVAPTCTETGLTEGKHCSACDAVLVKQEVVKANGHDYEAVVTAPTCTERGYTTHTCTVCGDSYVDNYVNATGHSYGAWSVTAAPTCTEKGTERRDCQNCDHFETREVAAKGHTEVIDEAVAPTCTETGLTEGKHCSACDAVLVKQEVVAAKGHSYKAVVTAPTCTERGYTTHTCTVCDDSYVDSYVNAKGHSYGAWSVTAAPTCTEKGIERRDCQNCDHFETREVAAKGHTEVIDEAVAPTCTETGLTEGKHCSACDVVLVKQEVVAANGHDYTSFVTVPTCTERGYTTHTCTACDDSYVDSYVDAKGHSYGAWSVTIVPTCTEQGTERRDCKNCDYFETCAIAAKGHTEVIDKAVAPTCTEIGLTEGKHCSVCDAVLVKQEVVAAKGHSYKSVVTAPTCTERGYTTHTCTACGDSYVDSYVNAKGHSYGAWSVTTAPTCTEQGVERRDCKNCGHFETCAIAAKGHTEVIDSAVAPTCTETGLTEGKHCSVCDAVLVKQEVVAANGHDYKAVVTAPTCTERGYTTHTCTVCDDSYVDSYVNAKGHSYSAWSVTTAPTCTEKGTEHRDCQNCDHFETRDIAAKGHTEVIDEAVEPTCTETGLTEGKHCSVCDAVLVKQEIVVANGHHYKSVVTAPTCTERGYTTHTCTVCGDSYVDSYVNAKGHSYDAWSVTTAPTCTEKGIERHDCKNCDHFETRTVAAKGHTEVIDEAVEPTCTETGLTEGKHCSVCEAVLVKQEVVAANGHDYDVVVTVPTCTEQGYTTHTCTVCGNSYVDSYVSAKGHSYGEWTVTTAPTCTEQGVERRDCKNCDHFETRTVAAKGHTEVIDEAVAPTCTETGRTEGKHCSVCDTVLVEQEVVAAKGHSYKSVVTAPTCTERGYTTHTCTVCDDSYVDSYVNAKGHSYGEWTVTTAPTCTEQGTERRDCQNCDHFETRDIAVKGHTEVIDEAVAPTCTETGLTEGKHCSACDAVLVKQEVVAAKGHSYKAVVIAPTCTEQGYTTHTCTVCGDSYVDNYVDATGHSYSAWSVTTAPTCTEKGIERRDCKNCDHFETRTVAAKGHTEVIDEAVEPTCTETGLTEGKHCSVCDAVLVEQEVVAANGHSYDAFVPVEDVPESGHYQSCSCGEETALERHEYGDDRICDICTYTLAPLRCDTVLPQTYTGEAITPAVKVYYGEKLLELDKDYTVNYSNNVNVPAKDALESELPTITIHGKGHYIDTLSVTFAIAKATPTLGNVSVVGAVKDTTDPNDVILTGTNVSADGTFALTDEKLLANVSTYHWTFTPTDTANYNVVTGEVEIDVLDTVAPSVVVTVEENQWRTTLNTITFGLFFKETKTVTIEYADNENGSGIDEMLYYVSDKAVADVANIPWKTYSKSFNIDPDGTFVIYAKAVDKDGNSAMVNSDGLVVDATAPLLKDIVDGGIYYGDLTITASDALAGVNTVTVDGDTVVLENGQYTIAADNSEHTVVVTDKAGNAQQYTVHVMKMYTVSGTVTSYLTGDVTIELLQDGAVKYTTTSATGTGVAYAINDVTAGTYTMKVSKANHITREYEVVVGTEAVELNVKICPKGDVNLDGEVNADDLTVLARHVAKIETLTDDYALFTADVDNNDVLSADDLTKLARYVAKIIPSL